MTLYPELVANGPTLPWAPPELPERIYPWPGYLKLTPAQERELAELFPDVEPPFRPMHNFITIQERLPRTRTKSGLILSEATQDRDRIDMNIGRVAAIGPLAFYSTLTLDFVQDNARVQLGEFVRIPKFGNDRPEESKIVWRQVPLDQISAVITSAEAILR